MNTYIFKGTDTWSQTGQAIVIIHALTESSARQELRLELTIKRRPDLVLHLTEVVKHDGIIFSNVEAWQIS